MPDNSYEVEAAYASALEAVAVGEERERTRLDVSDAFPSLTDEEVNSTLENALKDALRQGVEREDIDPSWLGRK